MKKISLIPLICLLSGRLLLSACETRGNQLDGNKLTFDPVTNTRHMFGEPPGVMEQENAHLAALSQVKLFKKSDHTLKMQAADGETILVFTPAGQ